eukprot:scaffold46087_cov63-Cyclotella_meneghiniana.AAC.1
MKLVSAAVAAAIGIAPSRSTPTGTNPTTKPTALPTFPLWSGEPDAPQNGSKGRPIKRKTWLPSRMLSISVLRSSKLFLHMPCIICLFRLPIFNRMRALLRLTLRISRV